MDLTVLFLEMICIACIFLCVIIYLGNRVDTFRILATRLPYAFFLSEIKVSIDLSNDTNREKFPLQNRGGEKN